MSKQNNDESLVKDQELIQKFLNELCEDPKSYAANHGHMHNKCCFCNLGLTDPKSVQWGYGPVCAKNWHMPHGVWTKEKAYG